MRREDGGNVQQARPDGDQAQAGLPLVEVGNYFGGRPVAVSFGRVPELEIANTFSITNPFGDKT